MDPKRLEPYEHWHSMQVAMFRQWEKASKGVPDAHGLDPVFGMAVHFNGSGGEEFGCKLVDLYWSGSFGKDHTDPDCSHRVDFKTTFKHDGEMPIHEQSPDNFRYVHISGLCPFFVCRGWLPGRDCKNRDWFKSKGGRPPAYHVPQKALRPIYELKMIIAQERIEALRSEENAGKWRMGTGGSDQPEDILGAEDRPERVSQGHIDF